MQHLPKQTSNVVKGQRIYYKSTEKNTQASILSSLGIQANNNHLECYFLFCYFSQINHKLKACWDQQHPTIPSKI